MEPNIIKAQWQNWAGDTIENLVLKKTNEGILVESIIITTSKEMKNPTTTTIKYTIKCDSLWRVRKLNIRSVQMKKEISLKSDGLGKWFDDLGTTTLNDLNEAFDVDIEATPFTNTLPIRRLNLKEKQTEEILVVYITVPRLNIFVDRQRYTCLIPNKRYRFEQLDTEFVQDIEVDKYGLVLIYPNLFKRVKGRKGANRGTGIYE
jgi:uncharacterized protein